MRKLKVVGGFVHPDEKGNITIPPAEALKMEINNNKDWVEIPVSKTHKKETER